MKHTESYIDNSIKDPEHLPSNVQGILDDLRKYDKEGNGIGYTDRLDDLWVIVKNAMASNAMSQWAWDVIVQKYWTHADKIYYAECKTDKTETSEFINNA